MRLVPKRQRDKLEWCRAHVGTWAEHAGAIGTDAEMVAAFADEVAAAEAAVAEAAMARDRARSATLAAKVAMAKMGRRATGIVKQVRAKAQSSGDANVYVMASIPPEAAGSPIAAPGKPYAFGVELLGDGSLTLSWSCDHPAGSVGVVYHVWRRVVAGGEMGDAVYLGMVGKKKFHDKRPPVAGASRFIYEVQAARSTRRGPMATFPVNFGTSGSAPGISGSDPGSGFVPRGEAGTRSAA